MQDLKEMHTATLPFNQPVSAPPPSLSSLYWQIVFFFLDPHVTAIAYTSMIIWITQSQEASSKQISSPSPLALLEKNYCPTHIVLDCGLYIVGSQGRCVRH